MSVCEPVSRDSVLTNFEILPDDITGNLRSLIVGADYAFRPYSTTGSVNLVGAYDETVGVSSGWPNLGTDETVDQATAEVYAVSALANYYADVAPAPGPTEGAQSGTTPNAILHDGGSTIWAGPNVTTPPGIAVEVGDYVKLDDNGGNTLETTVIGFDYVGGEPTILLLADDLPVALTGGANFNVILAEIVPEQLLTASDVTLTATTVQADPAITFATTRTGSAVPLIAGTGYSDIYTTYRALRATSSAVGEVLSITTEAQLDTYFTGWQYPGSGLGFAVARALAPVQDPVLEDPPAVLCTAIETDDADGWNAAMALVQRRRDWYAIAPLTTTTAYKTIVQNSILARNAIGLDSEGFFVDTLTTQEVLVSGAGNTVEVDQSQTPGENRTVTRDGGIVAPFENAIAGDIVQIAGSDYIIETKISNQTVTITTAAGAGAGQVLNSVIHPLTIAEQAADYGAKAAALNNRSFSVIFPPDPEWEGEVVDGYLLAAAVAGLRGFAAPHEGLTAVQLEDGWGVPQSAYEFLGQLETLAEYGCFVLEQTEQVAVPNAVVLFAYTTDQSSTQTGREGIVANEDGIKRYINDALKCYIGRAKVVNSTLTAIRTDANNAISYLLSNTRISDFGTILITGIVSRPYQDPNQLDVIVVPIAITISSGIGDVDVQIVITIATAA